MLRKFQEIWYEEHNIIWLNILISNPKLFGRIAHETLRQQRQRDLGKRDRHHDIESNANGTIANSTWNQTANSTMKSTDGLWSWGMVPEGYSLNKSGKLDKIPSQEEWHPSIWRDRIIAASKDSCKIIGAQEWYWFQGASGNDQTPKLITAMMSGRSHVRSYFGSRSKMGMNLARPNIFFWSPSNLLIYPHNSPISFPTRSTSSTMRWTNNIVELFCIGDASNYDKSAAFARIAINASFRTSYLIVHSLI